MNDAELDKLLRGVPVPARDPAYWEEFPPTVIRHLAGPRSSGLSRPTRPWAGRFAWGIGLATACIVLAFLIGVRHGRDTAPEKAQIAAVEKAFAEICSLFPHQVRAIVMDDRGARLLLADEPNLPDSQPLFLTICGPKGCQRVITFSGEQIPINGEVCDVLVNGRGQVLVAGDGWVWSGADASRGDLPFRIRAHPLGSVL
jgi:hypothetical protein